MKKLFSLLLVILFSAALTYAQDMTDLKKKVQKMCDEYAKQMVEGDMSSIWKYYSDDVISLPSYEPMIKGLDGVKASYEKMNTSGTKFKTFSLNVTDVMQSGNLIVDIGTYNLTMQVPGMDQSMDDHGKYMNIWEKQSDGSLKMKVETWNSDINPWQQMDMPESKMEHGSN